MRESLDQNQPRIVRRSIGAQQTASRVHVFKSQTGRAYNVAWWPSIDACYLLNILIDT